MMSMPRISVFVLACLAGGVAALSSGCTHDVEFFCSAEKTCPDRYPDRPYCNMATRTCEANPTGGIDAGGGIDASGGIDAGGDDAGLADAGGGADAFNGQRVVVQVVGGGHVHTADGQIDCGASGVRTVCEASHSARLLIDDLTAYDESDPAELVGGRNSFLGWSVTGPIGDAYKCKDFARDCAINDPNPWTGTVVVTATFGTPGAHKWAKSFGTASDESLVAVAGTRRATVDRIFIAGNFSGTFDLGGQTVTSNSGSLDWYVAMLDPADGSVQWAIRGGGSGHDTAFDLSATDDGDVIVIAGLNCTRATSTSADCTGASSLRVVKLNGMTGASSWSNTYTGTSLSVTRGLVAVNTAPADVAAAGSFAIGGTFTGTLNVGGSDLTSTGTAADMFVAWMTSAGGHEKSVSYGTTDTDTDVWSLYRADDSVGATGGAGAVDFGGGPIQNAGGQDGFVFTSALATATPIAGAVFGVPGDDYALVTSDPLLGFPFSAGGCSGTGLGGGSACDGPEGNIPWIGVVQASMPAQGSTYVLGGKQHAAAALSVAVDMRGYATVAGFTDSQIGSEPNSMFRVGTADTASAWLAGFASVDDGSGDAPFRWIVTLDSTIPTADGRYTSLNDHDVTLGGEVVAGGHFYGDLTYEGETHTNKGSRDIVLIKVNP